MGGGGGRGERGHGWCGCSTDTKLWAFLVALLLLSVVEMLVGTLTTSLVVLADGVHQLSDVGGLAVGIWAEATARRCPDKRNVRTIGGLANCAFVLSVCLFILLEALDRLFDADPVSHPRLVILTGALSMVVNLGGAIAFWGYDPAAPSSSSSSSTSFDSDDLVVRSGVTATSGGWQHSGKMTTAAAAAADDDDDESGALLPSSTSNPHHHDENDDVGVTLLSTKPGGNSLSTSISLSHNKEDNDNRGGSVRITLAKPEMFSSGGSSSKTATEASVSITHGTGSGSGGSTSGSHTEANANMHALFLHTLGDLLGGLTAIISGALALVVSPHVVILVDSGLSMLAVCVLARVTWPLLVSCVNALMGEPPEHVDMSALQADLSAAPHVQHIALLRVTALDDDAAEAVLVASVAPDVDAPALCTAMRTLRCILTSHGIHSATIEPLFEDLGLQPPRIASSPAAGSHYEEQHQQSKRAGHAGIVVVGYDELFTTTTRPSSSSAGSSSSSSSGGGGSRV